MPAEWDDRNQGDDQGDYWWAGGENPLESYDAGAYQQHPEDPMLESLSESFDAYCSARGAFDEVKATTVDSITSLFHKALSPRDRSHGESKIYRSDPIGKIGWFLRANREDNTAVMLLYSHAGERGDVEFFLPTAVARSIDEAGIARNGGQPNHEFGGIMMSEIERFRPGAASSAAGYLVEMQIEGESIVTPKLFMLGRSAAMAIEHVNDLEETIAADKAQRRTPYVVHIEASTILALALSEVVQRENVVLGITGVELDRVPGVLQVGLMVLDIPELNPALQQIVPPESAGDGAGLLRESLLPATKIHEREVGYRFKVSEPFPGVLCPTFLDDRGRLFSKRSA